MQNKAEYKNAKRSRKMIEEAYLSLMMEKDIQKITVTEIVERADLNRGTFYAHFENSQAVLIQIENKIIDRIIGFLKELKPKEFFHNPLPLLTRVNDYMEENSEILRIILGAKGSEQFSAKLKEIFVDQLKNSDEVPETIKYTSKFHIRMHFFAGGFVNLYQAWFRGDLVQSMDEISMAMGEIITKTFSEIQENDFPLV